MGGGERRVWTSAPSFTDDDLVRVRQIEAIIPTWPSKGPLPPELVTLGESVFRTITGGATLKEAQASDRAGRRRS